MKVTNLYYFYYLNVIGGTETFLYQLAKKYNKYDITVVYEFGDAEQIKRLRKYVRCIQYHGQKFECERAFFNYGTNIIGNVTAKDYYLVIHADYKALKQTNPNWKLSLHPKLNKFIAVSHNAAKSFTELTGKKCEMSYNPFIPETPKKVLHLISATRLTKEKGKYRMVQLGNALNKAGIPYIWTIFTNDTDAIDNPNIIYMKPRMDITNYIADADYLVQLSDNEGYCYSVVEALCAGTPVLVTPCPVFNEIGLKDKENCYILPFDMKDIPINEIYNHIPQFEYTALEDSWEQFFVHEPSTYEEDKKKKYLVKATDKYQQLNIKDSQLDRIPRPNETWEVDYYRLLYLLGNNPKLIKFVKQVD